MTEPDRTFEEEIRRALYAAGDLVVPAGDGLNKIRERAARRPPVLSWLLAWAAHLPRRLVHGGRVAASEVAATTHGYSSLGLVLASARRWPGKARHVLRTPGIWLRPVLATATALVLVVGVTLSIPRLRHQVTAQLDSAFGGSSNQGPSGPNGSALGSGVAQSSSATQMNTPASPTHMPGKPFLATMAPGSTQCRDQSSSGTSGTVAARQASGTAYLGPAPAQIGPPPVSVACPASTSPANQSTTLPVSSPTTVPYTSLTTPPTTPATTPPTTPSTTPPTTPTTTPPTTPTTTPPTTPSTTTSPATSTSSANGTQSDGPTDTATQGSGAAATPAN